MKSKKNIQATAPFDRDYGKHHLIYHVLYEKNVKSAQDLLKHEKKNRILSANSPGESALSKAAFLGTNARDFMRKLLSGKINTTPPYNQNKVNTIHKLWLKTHDDLLKDQEFKEFFDRFTQGCTAEEKDEVEQYLLYSYRFQVISLTTKELLKIHPSQAVSIAEYINQVHIAMGLDKSLSSRKVHKNINTTINNKIEANISNIIEYDTVLLDRKPKSNKKISATERKFAIEKSLMHNKLWKYLPKKAQQQKINQVWDIVKNNEKNQAIQLNDDLQTINEQINIIEELKKNAHNSTQKLEHNKNNLENIKSDLITLQKSPNNKKKCDDLKELHNTLQKEKISIARFKRRAINKKSNQFKKRLQSIDNAYNHNERSDKNSKNITYQKDSKTTQKPSWINREPSKIKKNTRRKNHLIDRKKNIRPKR